MKYPGHGRPRHQELGKKPACSSAHVNYSALAWPDLKIEQRTVQALGPREHMSVELFQAMLIDFHSIVDMTSEYLRVARLTGSQGVLESGPCAEKVIVC